jgi:hypothetical protein
MMYEYIYYMYIYICLHCIIVNNNNKNNRFFCRKHFFHVHLNILDKVVSSLYAIFGTPCIYMFNDFRVRYDSNMQYTYINNISVFSNI